MIPIKSDDEIARIRASCGIAANVLDALVQLVAPGINTYDLDQHAKRLIAGYGARSACFGYRHGHRVFPAYTCLSVNEEVVHGIGSKRRVLRPGDVITVDVCVEYDGFVGDTARTIPIGPIGRDVANLLQVAEEALYKGIDQARTGKRVSDISHQIQRHCESGGFSVIRDFVGHGIGRLMHENPQIPNFGPPGRGEKLRAGMTLAIEPMVAMGRSEIEMLTDGWTAVTRDRAPSAHFEHTVLITEGAPEILTIPKN